MHRQTHRYDGYAVDSLSSIPRIEVNRTIQKPEGPTKYLAPLRYLVIGKVHRVLEHVMAKIRGNGEKHRMKLARFTTANRVD